MPPEAGSGAGWCETSKAVVALACMLVALEMVGCGGIIPEKADRH